MTPPSRAQRLLLPMWAVAPRIHRRTSLDALPPKHRSILDQRHPDARPRRGDGRTRPRHSAANDNQITLDLLRDEFT